MENKKLTKGHDKKVAAVCSGVAEYFGWDVGMVRIATALLCLFWGTGLLVYIVAALVLPEPNDMF